MDGLSFRWVYRLSKKSSIKAGKDTWRSLRPTLSVCEYKYCVPFIKIWDPILGVIVAYGALSEIADYYFFDPLR